MGHSQTSTIRMHKNVPSSHQVTSIEVDFGSFFRGTGPKEFFPEMNQTRFLGPQNMATHVYLPYLGRFLFLMLQVPIAPFKSQLQLFAYCDAAPVGGLWETLRDVVFGFPTAVKKGFQKGFVEPWNNWWGRWFRRLFTRVTTFAVRAVYLQDREIWESKIMTKPRNQIRGDYSWAKYDKWIGQFYSPNSIQYNGRRKEEGLEW